MNTPDPNEVVESFVRQTLASRKYRHLCEQTIRDVIRTALPRYKRTRDAVKAARTKLHRIQAAYLVSPSSRMNRESFGRYIEDIRRSFRSGNYEALRAICLGLMEEHASTRERIPLLPRFYADIFAITGVPKVLLDVACGLHPLSIPWMGLPQDAIYYAYEIEGNLVTRLNEFLEAIGRPPLVKFQDVICTPPQEKGDLAFLMKMVPCLERREKGIALRLIENLKVRYVVATFPVLSLSGRSKHMPQFYTEFFRKMVAGHDWRIVHVPMEGELVFVVDKGVAEGTQVCSCKNDEKGEFSGHGVSHAAQGGC